MQSVPTTTKLSSIPTNTEVYSIQPYVIKYVSNLKKFTSFLCVLIFLYQSNWPARNISS